MPGAPFLQVGDSYQGVQNEGTPMQAGTQSHTAFIVWLVVLGILVPAVILGGFRAAGFQFVFRRR